MQTITLIRLTREDQNLLKNFNNYKDLNDFIIYCTAIKLKELDEFYKGVYIRQSIINYTINFNSITSYNMYHNFPYHITSEEFVRNFNQILLNMVSSFTEYKLTKHNSSQLNINISVQFIDNDIITLSCFCVD